MKTIAKPFGLLMMWLYKITSSYGLALILFALIVKIILLPFQLKSKRSSIQMNRLQGQLKELEKKHGANRQKYNEEVQKLYREEGVSPMGGCLWSLIPFPILIALYYAIRYPITTMMGVAESALAEGGLLLNKLTELGFSPSLNAAYAQIEQSQFITKNWDAFKNLGIAKLTTIDYSFLGLDLGAKPALASIGAAFKGTGTWAAAALVLIPILAGVLSFIQSKVSVALTPTTAKNGDGQDANPAANSMKSMMYIMPLMSVYFAFIMPAALGVYWIAGNVFAIIQEIIFNKHFAKIIAIEDAEYNAKREAKERELEEKRQETERLKAENATKRNENTSKKKLHLSSREEQRGKAAEWEKRKNATETDEEESQSRVGERKYARGRAYMEDRYAGGIDHTVRTDNEIPEETSELALVDEAVANADAEGNENND